MAVELTREQQAVVSTRGGQLLVSAAAGSGKTFVLVQRLLDRVLREGLNVDQFLMITFTKAAATELRGKILSAIQKALREQPDNAHLRRQATLIYRTQISTIHAFCSRLLRESSAQLNLDPDFRLMDDGEAGLLRQLTLERVLEDAYQHLDEGNFSVLVDSMSAGRDDRRLREMVLDIHGRIQSHPDPARWLREQDAVFQFAGVTDVAQTAWGKLLLEDTRELATFWRGQMMGAVEAMAADPELESAYGDSFRGTVVGLDELIAATDQGWDAAAACAAVPFPKLKASRKIQDKGLQERVKTLREQCKKKLASLTDRFAGDSAALLADLRTVSVPVRELFRMVQTFEEAYQQAKRRRKALDFNDLEHFTAHALVDDQGQPTSLAKQWRDAFVEVMVDEYQDTNAVQNVIFDALTDGGKHLFQVGDVKQSIYRFRLADPSIFLHKFDTFARPDTAQPGDPQVLVLSKNFRSRPSVLEAVNFIFEHIMTPSFGEIAYTEEQRLYPGMEFPEHPNDRTELNVVDLGQVEQEEDAVSLSKDQAEAYFVARRVRQLLDEPFMVTHGVDLRCVRPEDIAILYRSPNKVLLHLTKALDEAQVPWQLAGEEDFFHSTEVRVALAFLQVIDNPREDVPLIAVLRSPVYGFTGDQLALLRAHCPEGDFYQCVQHGAESGDSACVDFLDELNRLRLLAPDLSAAQLLWELYDRTGLLGIFGSMAGGQRRQENLLAFYQYTRSCQSRGHAGLFDFVRDLRRVLEQGSKLPGVPGRQGRGVQIMSIHKSKGLEFPVVVLAGLSRKCNKADEMAPMLFHPKLGVGPKGLDPELRVEFPTLARQAVQLQLDKEMKAEELRLLYVAMTRAKDKLILVMTLPNAAKTIASLLPNAGAHPDPRTLFQRDSVGEWMLLPILARADAEELWGIQTPEHILQPADHWDIFCHRPSQPEGLGGEHDAEPTEETPEPDLSWLTWHYPDPILSQLPSKVTATQMKGRLLDAEAAEETGTSAPWQGEFARPRFEQAQRGVTPAQRGSAMHCVMEQIDLDEAVEERTVKQEVQRLVDGGWLTPAQGKSVNAAQIAAFWASDWGWQARMASDLRREFKFSTLMPASRYHPDAPEGETMLLQGVVDCCFTGGDGLTVIDFKTDRVTPETAEERAQFYRGQVELYSQALTALTGTPVVHKVLWFFALGRGFEV